MLKTALLIGLPLALVGNELYKASKVLGLGQGPVSSYNVDRCSHIPGLEACEDVWVHPTAEVAYL